MGYSILDILCMKEDEPRFRRFIKSSEPWVRATSFILAKRMNGRQNELYSLIVYGLWDSIHKLDDRSNNIGVVYTMAVNYAIVSYEAERNTQSQQIENMSVAYDDIKDSELDRTSYVDDGFNDVEYDYLMMKLRAEIPDGDFWVIQFLSDGYALSELEKVYGTPNSTVYDVVKTYSNQTIHANRHVDAYMDLVFSRI